MNRTEPFDWDAVARSLGEPGEDTEGRRMAMLQKFLAWLMVGGRSAKNLAHGGPVWRRIVVVRWYLDPTHNGKSETLTQLARRHRVCPHSLTQTSAQFRRIFEPLSPPF
jgi:hypothetical protein